MKEENEILDMPERKKEKARFYILFWIAGVLLVMHYVFRFMHWPYANYLLIFSGAFYELFSLLRLIYYPDKSLFQIYSYLFFLFVIPGFILDYLHFPWAKFLLFIALIFPLLFFGHALFKYIKKK